MRDRVLAEVHARPFVPIEGSKRILHFAFMTDHDEAAKARAALADFCLERGCPPPPPDAKQHRVELPDAVLRFELHAEFTTYTWEFPQAIDNSRFAKTKPLPFRPGADELSSIMLHLPQPGPLLVSVDLHLLPAALVGDSWRHLFEPSQLAASEVLGGAALVATDFRPDASGFVRLLVLDRKLTPVDAGSLVQRLLEVETYRTLALLGLPKALDLGPEIRRIENELPRLVQLMREAKGLEASRILLDRLTALAAELEEGAAQSLYRFGATRAYHELMSLRLESIGERSEPNLPTLAAFLTRRLTPAIRTCAATEARQDQLSRKLSRAAQLLRTRVDIELESQNRDLLRNMNERVQLQLKLQQAVKWVSIAAITYYLLSIFHLIFEGLHREVETVDPVVATAVAVPVIVVLVLWFFHRIGKRLAEP
ncbi:DUF3422 domain-containing protein [Methylocapsa polymorpha]|uniref:DUF3422 domain-containing protein n=1 Tax=Methylocapsa polymorpha TaxID=3080828 RepID=A0ABZ0HQN9_9HYPH|nr:DUF3422 domain-containing protein [Methylocapsa sp. RX1]